MPYFNMGYIYIGTVLYLSSNLHEQIEQALIGARG